MLGMEVYVVCLLAEFDQLGARKISRRSSAERLASHQQIAFETVFVLEGGSFWGSREGR